MHNLEVCGIYRKMGLKVFIQSMVFGLSNTFDGIRIKSCDKCRLIQSLFGIKSFNTNFDLEVKSSKIEFPAE